MSPWESVGKPLGADVRFSFVFPTLNGGTKHVLHKKRSCTIQRKIVHQFRKDERFEESDVCSGCKYIVLNDL